MSETKKSIVNKRQIKSDYPKGVLDPKQGQQKFDLIRLLPSNGLDFFIEHYWIVKWNLNEGETYTTEILPYPSIHIVFERNYSRIVGVMEDKFTRQLEGSDKVLGIKFKPGAFFPFVKKSISELTNKFIKLDKYFNVDVEMLESSILNSDSEEEMINHAENFLLKAIPGKDDNIVLVNKIIDLTSEDRTIVKVDDIVNKVKINKRSLQRLFSQYVGVTPKWIIKRFRLHDAVDNISKSKKVNWSKLASELGYFDQAHFIKDFKLIIGKTPLEYEKQINSLEK